MIGDVVTALGIGLPHLLLHFLVTLALLVGGVAVYMAVVPLHERTEIERGNAAAGVVLAGAIIAIALPLAAMLATSGAVLDIVVWGVVAIIIQLLTVGVASLAFRRLHRLIEGGNVAAALALAATEVAVGLLNAAVMVPN
jgi:putative membrane protein